MRTYKWKLGARSYRNYIEETLNNAVRLILLKKYNNGIVMEGNLKLMAEVVGDVSLGELSKKKKKRGNQKVDYKEETTV